MSIDMGPAQQAAKKFIEYETKKLALVWQMAVLRSLSNWGLERAPGGPLGEGTIGPADLAYSLREAVRWTLAAADIKMGEE